MQDWGEEKVASQRTLKVSKVPKLRKIKNSNTGGSIKYYINYTGWFSVIVYNLFIKTCSF